jgi:pectate lyase
MKLKNCIAPLASAALVLMCLSCEFVTGSPETNAETLSPAQIYEACKGKAVTTYGWADAALTGMRYANPELNAAAGNGLDWDGNPVQQSYILIDDATYDPGNTPQGKLAKTRAFAYAVWEGRLPPPVPGGGDIEPNTAAHWPTWHSANATAAGGSARHDLEKFIIVSGDIDLSRGDITDADKSAYEQYNFDGNQAASGAGNTPRDYFISSNTTLIGIDQARIKFGRVRFEGVPEGSQYNIDYYNPAWDYPGNTSHKNSGRLGPFENVIIRNIEFWDAHGTTSQNSMRPGSGESKNGDDAVTLGGTAPDFGNQFGTRNIWIDHCGFSDGLCWDMARNYNHDGALDIPQGAYVTISYCEFYNHDKVMLISGGDDRFLMEARTITLHHNYFHTTTQRTPRSRATMLHLYNNYWDEIGVPGNKGYLLGPGRASWYIVENNYFSDDRIGSIIEFYDPIHPTYGTDGERYDYDIGDTQHNGGRPLHPWLSPYKDPVKVNGVFLSGKKWEPQTNPLNSREITNTNMRDEAAGWQAAMTLKYPPYDFSIPRRNLFSKVWWGAGNYPAAIDFSKRGNHWSTNSPNVIDDIELRIMTEENQLDTDGVWDTFWSPPYEYKSNMEAAAALPETLPREAGSGKRFVKSASAAGFSLTGPSLWRMVAGRGKYARHK